MWTSQWAVKPVHFHSFSGCRFWLRLCHELPAEVGVDTSREGLGRGLGMHFPTCWEALKRWLNSFSKTLDIFEPQPAFPFHASARTIFVEFWCRWPHLWTYPSWFFSARRSGTQTEALRLALKQMAWTPSSRDPWHCQGWPSWDGLGQPVKMVVKWWWKPTEIGVFTALCEHLHVVGGCRVRQTIHFSLKMFEIVWVSLDFAKTALWWSCTFLSLLLLIGGLRISPDLLPFQDERLFSPSVFGGWMLISAICVVVHCVTEWSLMASSS